MYVHALMCFELRISVTEETCLRSVSFSSLSQCRSVGLVCEMSTWAEYLKKNLSNFLMNGSIPNYCQQQSTAVMDIQYFVMNNECCIVGFCHSKFIDQSLVHCVRIFLKIALSADQKCIMFSTQYQGAIRAKFYFLRHKSIQIFKKQRNFCRKVL